MAALFNAMEEYALLSAELDEQSAIKYFNEHVTGKHRNTHGEIITVKPNDYRFLYEDHSPSDGRFKAFKARRLNWIVPVLERSDRIKLQVRNKGPRQLYLAYVGVPHIIFGVQTFLPEYFYVVVAVRGKYLDFVTAHQLQMQQFNNFRDNLPDAYPGISQV